VRTRLKKIVYISLRRICQIVSFILINLPIIILFNEKFELFPTKMEFPLSDIFANIYTNVENYLRSHPLVLPISYPYSAPNTVVAGAFDVIQRYAFELWFPLVALGVVVVTAVLLGRAFCGWVCPFGFIQDIVGALNPNHLKVSHRTNYTLMKVKYWLLGVIILITTIFVLARILNWHTLLEAFEPLTQGIYTAIDPSVFLFSAIPRIILEGRISLKTISEIIKWPYFFWLRLSILVFVIVLSFFVPRAWCRWFCPMGALQGALSGNSVIRVSRRIALCLKEACKERYCMEMCPMGINILREHWENIKSRECIRCLACIVACKENALRLSVSL